MEPPLSTINDILFFHKSNNRTNKTQTQYALKKKNQNSRKNLFRRPCPNLLNTFHLPPVPEPVRGRGGVQVKLGHRHSPGRHLGGKHGGRINHRGCSHLQANRWKQTNDHTVRRRNMFSQNLTQTPAGLWLQVWGKLSWMG